MILGVYDARQNADAVLAARPLGQAIMFVAPNDGFIVQAATVMFGEPGNPPLRAQDCARLWAKYGKALIDGRNPDCELFFTGWLTCSIL
jgi:hypothetical protein